jgi:hypothetical protein
MNMKTIQETNDGVAKSGLSKKEHYSWSDLDSKCEHMRLPINLLRVDSSYQRGEASNQSTIDKAKNMQHAAIGAIIVAKRNDGSLWIVDGLQRTLAAKKRGDVNEIDCMVFNSHGPKHEAEVFLLCNKGRVAVSAMHKYRTSVTAGRLPEREIDEWLTNNGYQVADHSGINMIRFPSRLIQAWQMNPEATKQALLITTEICGDDPVCDVFSGVAILLRNGINVKSEVKKIITLGGATRILKEINTIAVTLAVAKSLRVCGMGVLAVINHKRHRKITVQSWEK